MSNTRIRVLFLTAAFLSLFMAVGLWFSGSKEQGAFVGLWVPSILALGAFVAATQPHLEPEEVEHA